MPFDALPSQCAVCRAWSRGRLCGACASRFAAEVPRCPRCALRSAGAAVCGACLRQPLPFDACVAALDYAFPWDGLVAALKFRDELDLATALARCVARAVAAHGPWRPQLVVPVPLSTARLRQRGYNQAWELARRAATMLGLDARPDVLSRRRELPPQSGLSRADRLAGMHGSFDVAAPDRPRVEGRDIALVDDVMTTGATAADATRALRDAGARSVHVWVAARTAAPA